MAINPEMAYDAAADALRCREPRQGDSIPLEASPNGAVAPKPGGFDNISRLSQLLSPLRPPRQTVMPQQREIERIMDPELALASPDVGHRAALEPIPLSCVHIVKEGHASLQPSTGPNPPEKELISVSPIPSLARNPGSAPGNHGIGSSMEKPQPVLSLLPAPMAAAAPTSGPKACRDCYSPGTESHMKKSELAITLPYLLSPAAPTPTSIALNTSPSSSALYNAQQLSRALRTVLHFSSWLVLLHVLTATTYVVHMAVPAETDSSTMHVPDPTNNANLFNSTNTNSDNTTTAYETQPRLVKTSPFAFVLPVALAAAGYLLALGPLTTMHRAGSGSLRPFGGVWNAIVRPILRTVLSVLAFALATLVPIVAGDLLGVWNERIDLHGDTPDGGGQLIGAKEHFLSFAGRYIWDVGQFLFSHRVGDLIDMSRLRPVPSEFDETAAIPRPLPALGLLYPFALLFVAGIGALGALVPVLVLAVRPHLHYAYVNAEREAAEAQTKNGNGQRVAEARLIGREVPCQDPYNTSHHYSIPRTCDSGEALDRTSSEVGDASTTGLHEAQLLLIAAAGLCGAWLHFWAGSAMLVGALAADLAVVPMFTAKTPPVESRFRRVASNFLWTLLWSAVLVVALCYAGIVPPRSQVARIGAEGVTVVADANGYGGVVCFAAFMAITSLANLPWLRDLLAGPERTAERSKARLLLENLTLPTLLMQGAGVSITSALLPQYEALCTGVSELAESVAQGLGDERAGVTSPLHELQNICAVYPVVRWVGMLAVVGVMAAMSASTIGKCVRGALSEWSGPRDGEEEGGTDRDEDGEERYMDIG